MGICLDAGVNLFDTADAYSDGLSEIILGKAVESFRTKVLISTKTSPHQSGGVENDRSWSRRLVSACEASLRRMNTDYIDIYTIQGFDLLTSPEETLRTLDDLVQSGKVRHIACSNFSGWQLMKSISISKTCGYGRYIAHQVYYSLIGREFEWELLPLALDQSLGTIVWSPLAGGRLTGKMRRDQPAPVGTRIASGVKAPPFETEQLYRVLDVLDEISQETGYTIAQIAINWLLGRPAVNTVLFGSRDETQLRENLGAIGWSLTSQQVAKLDLASRTNPIYPYWHQVRNNP